MNKKHIRILFLLFALSCVGYPVCSADENAQCAESTILKGDYAAAVKILSEKLSAKPEDWNSRLLILDISELTGDRTLFGEQKNFLLSLYRQGKIKDAPALTVLAEAIKDENPNMAVKFFNEAHKADDKYLETYLRAGNFYHEKYETGKAEKEFQKALEIKPSDERALLGLADLALNNGNVVLAEEQMGKALAANPSSTRARAGKAVLYLLKKDYPACKSELDKVLAENPNEPDSLTILAAYHDSIGDAKGRDETLERIHKINPINSEVFVVLSNLAESRYSFVEALEWARKAIAANTSDWSGYYHCGMALVRLGEEKEGYGMLDKAFKKNPYNVLAYNMLQSMDKDFRKHEYVVKETAHFAVKIHRDEAEVIWPYMEMFLEDNYKKLTSKYSFEPSGPKEFNGKILILLLPTHQDFAVRTVGLPSLNAAGVCFGRMIAMPSPRFLQNSQIRELPWKAIFQHEFEHVITLQKTNYKIPRWFTEGLSCVEGQESSIERSLLFSQAFEKHLMLPPDKLEPGFVVGGNLLGVYYEHAKMICEHIEKKYGFAKLIEMLDMYKAGGHTTEEILEKATGKNLKDLAQELVDNSDANYREFQNYMDASGLKAISEKSKEEQKKNPDSNLKSAPAWKIKLKSFLDEKKTTEAVDFLENYKKYDNSTCEVYKILAGLHEEQANNEKALENLEQSFFINPYDIETHLSAARLYKKVGNNDKATREYKILLLLDKENAEALDYVNGKGK